jgi:hypothetical protein
MTANGFNGRNILESLNEKPVEGLYDRFDLEQQIMKCWTITDDLKLLRQNVLEKNMSTDDITNFILGLETIYECKFNELFDQFSYLIQVGKIK